MTSDPSHKSADETPKSKPAHEPADDGFPPEKDVSTPPHGTDQADDDQE